jgi:uncharacterized protein (TIRG00374 family)
METAAHRSTASIALPASQGRPGSRVKVAIKMIAVLALLGVLGYKGALSIDKTKQALLDFGHVIPAFGLMMFTMVLGMVRWQWLLKAQGISLPFLRTAELTLIGNFFNVALPGAVSGDLVKAFYVGKEVEGQRARAFGAILFDRVVGLSALVMVSAGALTVGFASFVGTPLLHGIRVLMILAAAGVISFYAYLFMVREHHDPLLRALKHFEKKIPRVDSVTRIYLGLRHYHHHPMTVARALALSIGVHLLVGLASLWFARALGDAVTPLVAVYVVVPLGLLVTAVPVAPAGVGTGHAAFFFLFRLIGSQVGPDVYTLYAIAMVLIALIGGVVYLRFKTVAGPAS